MKRLHRRSATSDTRPTEKEKRPFFPKIQHASSTPSGGFFQAKEELRIGSPGDRHEREADAVADAVVGHSFVPGATAGGKPEVLQRYMTNEEYDERGTNTERIEEDKRVQEKPELDRPEDETLQRQVEEERKDGAL